MSNSNHSAKFINMLIALMASIAIALTCIVPTALAEDGDGTDGNNGGSTVQPLMAARISPFPAVRTRSITIRCGRAIP